MPNKLPPMKLRAMIHNAIRIHIGKVRPQAVNGNKKQYTPKTNKKQVTRKYIIAKFKGSFVNDNETLLPVSRLGSVTRSVHKAECELPRSDPVFRDPLPPLFLTLSPLSVKSMQPYSDLIS